MSVLEVPAGQTSRLVVTWVWVLPAASVVLSGAFLGWLWSQTKATGDTQFLRWIMTIGLVFFVVECFRLASRWKRVCARPAVTVTATAVSIRIWRKPGRLEVPLENVAQIRVIDVGFGRSRIEVVRRDGVELTTDATGDTASHSFIDQARDLARLTHSMLVVYGSIAESPDDHYPDSWKFLTHNEVQAAHKVRRTWLSLFGVIVFAGALMFWGPPFGGSAFVVRVLAGIVTAGSLVAFLRLNQRWRDETQTVVTTRFPASAVAGGQHD